MIIIQYTIHRRFVTRRNTTKSLQGRASTQWLMTCHTKIIVSRHIGQGLSVRIELSVVKRDFNATLKHLTEQMMNYYNT